MHRQRTVYLLVLIGWNAVCVWGQPDRFDSFGGLSALKAKPTGVFRLDTFGKRDLFVTPEGHGFLALGINHLGTLGKGRDRSFFATRFNRDWDNYFTQELKAQLKTWHFNNLGYGPPQDLMDDMPYFAAVSLVPISKYRAIPVPGRPGAYQFPDVFDPAWQEAVARKVTNFCKAHRNNPMLIGYFWTDTPTLDLLKTRALRGTEWVGAIRTMSETAPGRQAYITFLKERYHGRLDDFNEYYAQDLGNLVDMASTDPSTFPIGRHRVRDDDEAFLALIARRYYDTLGKAQREADPDHLVFGDRYLLGDVPDCFLEAVAPWIDGVAVQPGDRYTRLNPGGTVFPEEAFDHIHRVSGKPVLICDHAIPYPTKEYRRSVFEQMPTEAQAAKAIQRFLSDAFKKPYILGYLRCQFVDQPAGLGRGLKHGIVNPNGEAHEKIVNAYRNGFAAILSELEKLPSYQH